MKQVRVKELMIPLEEYTTVGDEATLYEAVKALKESQKKYFDKAREEGRMKYPHRAVLVLNADGRVVGKVGQLDVLRALEPKYSEIMKSASIGPLSASGFAVWFLEDMVKRYGLFSSAIGDICQKAAQRRVRDFMYTPQEGEFVREDDTLDKAVHNLVMGYHQSLLVLDDNGTIVGILRLVDVFETIAEAIEACPI